MPETSFSVSIFIIFHFGNIHVYVTPGKKI